MNEQAFEDLYKEFVNTGYRGSKADFKVLLQTNPDAFSEGYGAFTSTGYKGSDEDFAKLMGVVNPLKKKESSENAMDSTLADGSSALSEFDAETFFANYDPNKITPQDQRSTDYRDPMRMGMYPTQDQIDRGIRQSLADVQYTDSIMKSEQPDLERQQQIEQLAEQQREELDAARKLGIQSSDVFIADISKIDKNLIDKNEDEVVPFLRDNFSKYGFVFEKTGIGDAVIVTAPDGSTSVTIDLDPFTSGTEIAESKRLKNFIKNNLSEDLDGQTTIADKVTQSLKAKNLREVGRDNEDGTISTVLFASGEVDGKNIVVPTLFPVDPNEYTSNPRYWEELPFDEAVARAQERGEIFEFETQEEAQDFAEGSWKDVNTHDAEAKQFFQERGLNYDREMDIVKRYEENKSLMDYLERGPLFKLDELAPEDQEKYAQLYINGKLRQDYRDIYEETLATHEQLKDDYLNDEAELAREDFDLYLNKRYQKDIGNAIRVNNDARLIQDQVEKESLLRYGVKANDLRTVVPANDNEVADIKRLQERYVVALSESEKAADVYQNAKLYYDMKHDKMAQLDYTENWEGFLDEWHNGLSRGKAGDVILMASMFPELLGGYDLDDPESTQKAAKKIVEYLQDRSNTKSRVLSRWQKANGFDEIWDVIADNPFEWASTLAGQSLSMMLPYGSKIIASSTAIGTGTGFAYGSVVPGAGNVAGAATGFTWGFRSGFAATNVAMEYTNAVIDAISNQGYNITDPESVAAALQNEKVWAEGKERGLKRGIPIAIVDLITAKLAGNLFRTGSVAGRGKRVAALTAERLIADPIGEGTGEYLAQMNVGDDLNWKEIVAEMGGGIGNNSSNMAINLALEVRAKNDLELATNLSNIDFMSKELSSDSKISAWANNMEKLGKIDAQTNQAIQENVGYRKTARELLKTGKLGQRFKGKNALALEQRVMTLLAAKNELSSSQNRKEVFAPKIKEINAELSEILTTKELRTPESQTLLAGTGVLSVQEQATGTDLRAGKPTYKIRKGFRGKIGQFTEVSKEEFVEYINGLDPRQLGRLNASIENDDEVSQMVANKLIEAKVAPAQAVAKAATDGDVTVEEGQVTETTTPAVETPTQMQEQTAEDGVSLKTLETQEAVTDNDAAVQEVTDLEQSLQEKESGTKPKVDFKLKTTNENNTDNIGPDEIEITTEINEIESPNIDVTVESQEGTADINIDELNTRTDNPLKVTKLEVIKGLPTIFSITDQLTTGTVVNPETNTTIDNLKGAIGFNGTVGNEQAAWANVTEKEAQSVINKAEQVYLNNQKIFDDYWAKNPELKGLVPMNIVKMGEQAMVSNEAVIRVLLDNMQKIPLKNRKAAVPVLKEAIQKNITFLESKAKPPKDLGEYIQLLDVIEKLNPTSVDQLLNNEVIQTLPLPVRSHLVKLMTTSKANTPLQPSKRTNQKVTTKTKAVPTTLLKGVPNTNLLNIGMITDLVTDPQLRNVPGGNVVSIVGVDVLNPGIVETTHPNYKYGVRGKSIGILENPQRMETVYPKAYQKVFSKLIEKEEGIKPDSKPSQIKRLRSEQLGIGIGIPSFDYVGIIANESPTNVDKLNAFMNIAFPGVVINSDTDTFNNVLASDNVRVYLKGDEVVYGVTVDGDIYINPEVHNSESQLFNTAIHEMGHVWIDYLQTTEQGKKVYEKGAKLVQQTDTFKEQLRRFDGDVDKATVEAMAILIGNKGETIANASLKAKFKEWLLGMWNYIKNNFSTRSADLTAEEIQDLNLDKFLGVALADIFAGQEIKMTDQQMKMLKNPEAAFSTGLSIDSIVEQGRREGFSDESIRVVLKNRGFKAKDITNALTVQIDLLKPMPREFGNVEGGAIVGQRLFTETRDAVNAFAIQGPRGGKGKAGVRTKSFAEIRQKALDLLRENPIYKVQPEQTQLEIENAFDRVLGIRANPNVRREIADIRNNLRQRKISEDNITDAQRRMRMIIRRLLPQSKNYSNRAINKLLKVVNETNPKNFDGKISEVLTEVEKQRGVIKNQLIDKIIDLVRKKSKTRKTTSGKRRSSGLDAAGQAYFAEVNRVLKAIKENNTEALSELESTVTPAIMSAIETKIAANIKLSTKEQQLIDRRLALDSFSDVLNMSLEQVEELFEDVKATRGESIARLNNRRELRRRKIEEQKQKFQEQISNDYSELYDENGKPLGKNALRNRNQRVRKAFSEGLWKGMKTFLNTFMENQKLSYNGVARFLQNNIAHLGTVTRLLDRNSEGMFTETFYNRLNDFDESNLQGVRRTENKMNAMTESTHNKTWEKWKYSLGEDTAEFTAIDSKTGNVYTETLSVDQAMRLYALSKNDIQRKKLEAQGIDLNQIKDFIGSENVELVDQVVDFLSNTYFEETNAVYSQVNDVNLGYVENYFPTKTLSKGDITSEMIGQGQFDKIFTAEYSPALKERTDLTGDVEIGLSFSEVMEDHVKSMEKYKAYALGVKEMNEILKDEQIVTLLEQSGLSLLFKQNLNYAINPESGPEVSNNILTKLQTRFTGFALAFKLIQIPKQASSFVQAFEKYDSGYKIPGADLLTFIRDYVEVIAMLRTNIREAREMSATFDARIKKGLEGDIFGLESGGRTFKRTKAKQTTRGKLSRGVQRAAGFTTVAGDILGVLGYKAVYNRAKKNGIGDAEALRLFNEYNATQQTRRATEKSPLQQKTSFFNRFFTMFGSSLYLMMNNVGQSSRAIFKTALVDGKPTQVKMSDVRKLALNYAGANVMFTLMSYAPALLHAKSDEEKDRAMRALRDAAFGLNLLYAIPIIGSGMEQFISKMEGTRRPVSDGVNPLSSVLRKMEKMHKKVEEGGTVLNYVQPIFEISIGMQLDAPLALFKALGGDFSDENMYDLTGVSKSYRPGYGMKEKKSSSKKDKGMSKSLLRDIDPDLYKEMYGPGTPDYELRKMKRELRKELKE
jgi:hypothetical protein